MCGVPVTLAIRRAFDQVDRERRGDLTRAEVREVLQLIGQNPTKADMDAFFGDIGMSTQYFFILYLIL